LTLVALAPAAGRAHSEHAPGAEPVLVQPGPEAGGEAQRVATLRAEMIRSAAPEEHRLDLAAAWADPSGALTELDLHGTVVAGVVVLGLLYALAVGPIRRRYGLAERVEARHVAWFTASLVTLLVTLNGPLHHMADFYLFSGHMLQHMILGMLFPCLFLAGIPGWLLSPLLRRRFWGSLGRRLTHPVTAYCIYNAVLIGWHLPPAYARAMLDHDVHILQHLTFMATGVIAFWPVLGPAPELPRLTYLWQIGYLFVMQIPMIALGAFLTLAEGVIYPFYEAAPRVLPWLSPLEDQQFGGLLMWLPGHLVLWIPMAVLFFRWYATQSDEATGVAPVRSPAVSR
jgi:putative membrane protein